jgi:hypothetical protein
MAKELAQDPAGSRLADRLQWTERIALVLDALVARLAAESAKQDHVLVGAAAEAGQDAVADADVEDASQTLWPPRPPARCESRPVARGAAIHVHHEPTLSLS